jgi:hypothetical protein
MTVVKLEKTHWHSFCDRASHGLMGKRAEIEVNSPIFGVQIEAKWLPVIGLVYDPASGVLDILLDGLDHMISHPRELYVQYGTGGVDSLGILDGDNCWQIVLLRDPVMLPAPHPAVS